MATAVRTDIHREGVLVPAHYQFVDVLDLYAGTSKDDVAAKVVSAAVPSAWTKFIAKMIQKVQRYRSQSIGDRPALSQCNICGAHIRYAVVWSYFPGAAFEGYITTGTDCAASMGSAKASEVAEKAGALREFVAGMRRAATEAEKAANGIPAETSKRWASVDQKRMAWIQESEDHKAVAYFLHRVSTAHAEDRCEGCFFCSVTRQLVEDGWLSDLQVECVMRSVRKHRNTGVDPAPKVSIPSGSATVSGSVTSVRSGGRPKALLNCGAYRVFFPIPAECGAVVVPKAQLQLTANLTPSRGDATFLLADDVRDVEVVI